MMSTLSQPLPNRLRVLRAERRLSQRETARLLGWSQSRYSLIETGYQPATVQDIDELVAVFGVSKAKIFPKSKAVA